MFNYRELTIGVVPTRRDFFPPKEGALKVKAQMMPVIKQIFAKHDIGYADIDSINPEGLLVENSDIPAIEKLFIERGVNALFFPHANFGQEEAVAKLAARMRLPVLLWGPRDEHPPARGTSIRQTDIQCGLFATSKAFQRYGVPFTYIENCALDAPELEEGIASFARVACAVKAFRGLRILQLSTRPRQFLTVKVNESELMEKFGIEVVPIESAEIVREVNGVLQGDSAAVDALVAEWKAGFKVDQMPDEKLTNMAAVEIAIIRLAEKYDCRVVSGECWSIFNANFGIRVCFLWGDLTQKGLPVACENDIHGCVTQAIMMGAARGDSPVFLADLTIRHPNNDNSELLWHCGPFPSVLAADPTDKEIVDCHGAWEIKGGDVTLARFDASKGEYLLFADECRGVKGPWTDGNYLWIQVDDWVKWEKKFIYGPYIHHIIGLHGKYRELLSEVCVYLGPVAHDNASLPAVR